MGMPLSRLQLSGAVVAQRPRHSILTAPGLWACRPHYVLSRPLEFRSPRRGQRDEERGLVDDVPPGCDRPLSTTTLPRLMREQLSLDAARHAEHDAPSHTSCSWRAPGGARGSNTSTIAKTDSWSSHRVVSRPPHGTRGAFFARPSSAAQRPGRSYSQRRWLGRPLARERTVHDARSTSRKSVNLLFVHFSDADSAGHGSGWMSAAYGRAVQTTDAALGQLLAAAEETYGPGNYSVLVTADHGGHDYGHGTKDARDVNIPWIAWGQGVKAGVIDEKIDTFDTAPTVLWLLGVKEPDGWDGEPVVEAFRPLAPTSAD